MNTGGYCDRPGRANCTRNRIFAAELIYSAGSDITFVARSSLVVALTSGPQPHIVPAKVAHSSCAATAPEPIWAWNGAFPAVADQKAVNPLPSSNPAIPLPPTCRHSRRM